MEYNTKKIDKLFEILFELWKEYKKDPKVYQNPNPPLGTVFTFEDFWLWLIKKYENLNL